MKTLLCEGPGKFVFRDAAVPETRPGELLVKVEACSLAGRPNEESLGSEVVGRVEKRGTGVAHFKVGDRVFVSRHAPCLECRFCQKGDSALCREFGRTDLEPGGVAPFLLASARHVELSTHKIRTKPPPLHTLMAGPLSLCVRNNNRLRLSEGDCAVVEGLGFFGLLAAQDLLRRGVRVIGVDSDPARVRLAQKLGVQQSYTGRDGRADTVILSSTGNWGADALVITTRAASQLPRRLGWVRDGGVISLLRRFPPRTEVKLPLDILHRRELTLVATRIAGPEELREAHDIIKHGQIDVSLHVKSTFALESFDEALRQVRGREILQAILLPQKAAPEGKKE